MSKGPRLAILIPTIVGREQSFDRLIKEIDRQREGKDVIVISLKDRKGEKTTGRKRNELIQAAVAANAEYVAFVDDDDMIGENYIKLNLEGCELGFDCNSLMGRIYFKGKPGNPFHHSIIYDHWWQDKTMYYRNPNHLNCIRLEKIKDIPFRDQTIGEDGHFSIDIQKAGVLKSEYQIKEIIYHYYK